MSNSAGKMLAGKRAVITAGASGLGLAIAEKFASEGARIALCDLPGPTLEDVRARHRDWITMPADVTDEAQMSTFFSHVTQSFGELDILVNNAGTAGPTAPIEDIDASAWRSTIDVNVFGTYLSTRLGVPLLRAAKGGSIINMSSAAGHLGFPFRTPYAVAKWGIIGLTKSLAIELGASGIRVNAIMPGMVGGARMDSVISARAQHLSRGFEEQKRLMLERVAMGTLVQASDIADMAAFLASSSSHMVSGQAIGVDAGLVSLA